MTRSKNCTDNYAPFPCEVCRVEFLKKSFKTTHETSCGHPSISNLTDKTDIHSLIDSREKIVESIKKFSGRIEKEYNGFNLMRSLRILEEDIQNLIIVQQAIDESCK